jgi:bifunctional DNase/RNase
MEKIPLKIIGFFQPVPSEKSCFVVLREEGGKRKIIVRIGIYETDAIIMSLENIKSTVPFIHDLFQNLAQMVSVDLKEVVIDGYSNDKFSSHILFIFSKHEIKVPARICDSIALAVRFRSPIMIFENVLNEHSIEKISDTEFLKNASAAESLPVPEEFAKLSHEELKKMLEKALERENYELAGKIRDELLKRNHPDAGIV